MSYKVEPDQIAAAVVGVERQIKHACLISIWRSAFQHRVLTSMTPRDKGLLRKSWRFTALADGAELRNTAPYSGELEAGGKPREVPPEEEIHLDEWAARNLTGRQRQRFAAVGEIIKEIETEGQSATRFVRTAMPYVVKALTYAINGQLKQEFNPRPEFQGPVERMG